MKITKNSNVIKVKEFINFLRFLKEQEECIYKFFIKDAFFDEYKIHEKNYYLFVFNSHHSYKLMTYNEYIIDKVRQYDTTMFVYMVNVRNAWYYEDKKIKYNIDWRILDELWLIYIIENKEKFSKTTIDSSLYRLMRDFHYKLTDLTKW